MMDEQTLKTYVPAYGDRIALRQFCRRKAEPKGKRKGELFQRLKKKLKQRLQKKSDSDSDNSDCAGREEKHEHLFGNQYAARQTRRIDIGWLNFNSTAREFKQVKEKRGGGIRRLTLDRNTTMATVSQLALSLFFPDGTSSLGSLDKFTYYLQDFKQSIVDEHDKISDIYQTTKVKLLRLYLCTTLTKEQTSPTGHQQEENLPKLAKPKKGTTPSATCTSATTIECTDPFEQYCIEIPFTSNEDTEPINTLIGSNNFEPDFLDISDVHFGPTNSASSDMLSETLDTSVNTTYSLATESTRGPSPLPQRDYENIAETLNPHIHRVNLVEELIMFFKNQEVVDVPVKFTFVNEEGADMSGVSRDVYTSFWSEFSSRSAEGEEARVPALNPKWQLEEWNAIGRILLKGYQDLRYFPLQLAPSFTYALIHGEHMVAPEILMSSFMLYLSKMDRDVVLQALNGILPNDETDDLVDILDRFGYTSVPKSEDLRHTFLQIAHKELIQKPKYALDAMVSVARIPLALLLSDNAAIEVMYCSQTPTVRKVLKLLKAEPSSSAEAESFEYLQRYIKAQSDPVRLRSLLHFVTGSDVLCVDKIDIMFTSGIGLGRRPIAHTCGPTLELPSTYQSYPDFRGEFDSILSTKECLTLGFA